MANPVIGNRRKFKLSGHRLNKSALERGLEEAEKAILLQQRVIFGRGFRYSQLAPHMSASYSEAQHDAALAAAGGVLSYLPTTASTWVPGVPTIVSLPSPGELGLIERNGVAKVVHYDPSLPGQATTITIPADPVAVPVGRVGIMLWRPAYQDGAPRQEVEWVIGTGEVTTPTDTISYELVEFLGDLVATFTSSSQNYWAQRLADGWFPLGIIRWVGLTPNVILFHAADGWSFAMPGIGKIQGRRRLDSYPALAYEPPPTALPTQAANVNDGLYYLAKRITDYMYALLYGGDSPDIDGVSTGSIVLNQRWHRNLTHADVGSSAISDTLQSLDIMYASIFNMLAVFRVQPALAPPNTNYSGPILPIYNRAANYTLTYGGHTDTPPYRNFTFTVASAGAPHTLLGVRHLVVGTGVAPWAFEGPAESRSERWRVDALPSLPCTVPASFTIRLSFTATELTLNSNLYIYLLGGA